MRIDFKGKDAIYNYHLTVPVRPLQADESRSIGDGNLSGNLIVHGDNLHALKALMPVYGGKVDCIFIDPPYNTGNEHWVYDDDVNSPPLRDWFRKEVGTDDLLRHEKWCCMMWPRLRLLRELLAETGSLWMTLDDNEVHRAKLLLDEIFGEENFVSHVIWEKTTSARNDAEYFSADHDHILVYAASRESLALNRMDRTTSAEAAYTNPDDDPRGPWREGDYKCAKSADERPNLYYPITNPFSGAEIWPRRERVWAYSRSEMQRHVRENQLWWGKTGNYTFPKLKRFRSEAPDELVPRTLWRASEVEQTRTARTQLQEIFSDNPFPTPKPLALIKRIIDLATVEGSVVLDSFAGSGTTGHAVLAAGQDRRFILVEMEDYADSITAERIRRVISGYKFEGSQREVLYEKALSWRELQRADTLVSDVRKVQETAGFDTVRPEVKDGKLRVIGERKISDVAPGLGGAFTFCTLGDPLDLDQMLSGECLPDWNVIATWLFHTAMGTTLPADRLVQGEGVDEWYVAESDTHHVWAVYRSDVEFLRKGEAALTLNLAKAIAERRNGKPHLVFAPYRLASNDQLRAFQVEYAALPFSLHRVENG